MLLTTNNEYVEKPFSHLCCQPDSIATNKGTNGHLYQCNGCLETWRGSDPQDQKTGVRKRHLAQCFQKEPKQPPLTIVPEPKRKTATVHRMSDFTKAAEDGNVYGVHIDMTVMRNRTITYLEADPKDD